MEHRVNKHSTTLLLASGNSFSKNNWLMRFLLCFCKLSCSSCFAYSHVCSSRTMRSSAVGGLKQVSDAKQECKRLFLQVPQLTIWDCISCSMIHLLLPKSVIVLEKNTYFLFQLNGQPQLQVLQIFNKQ